MNRKTILSVSLALLMIGSFGGVGIAATSYADTVEAQWQQSSTHIATPGTNWAQVGNGTGNGTGQTGNGTANGTAQAGNATGNGTTQAGNATGNGTAQANATTGPFNLSIRNITKCGQTCRQVTVILSNAGNVTANNVSVTSVIVANETVITTRRTQIDFLAPNESLSRTIQINITLQEVRAIQQNQGVITVVTVVTSNQYNETFVTKRQVT